MSEWQPIETAPRDGTMFIGVRLLCVASNADRRWREYFVSDASWQDGGYRFTDIMTGAPTHWMPFVPPDGPHTGCGARLADDQWWGYCGETDMGQTAPALCTDCGGDYLKA